jgi:hypothetical protein
VKQRLPESIQFLEVAARELGKTAVRAAASNGAVLKLPNVG